MKTRLQLTPELTAALLCAGVWFLVWLFAFQPLHTPSLAQSMRTEFTRLMADEETLNKLKAPTLFALPSKEGFSGNFIEETITRRLALEKPTSPTRYLPMTPPVVSKINPALLIEATPAQQGTLPIPGVDPQIAASAPTETLLFFSPELHPRAGDRSAITLRGAGLPETVRVNLSVGADGSVGHAFFQTPVTNAALLNAVRRLRFTPGPEKTEGWIDIRFAQEGVK